MSGGGARTGLTSRSRRAGVLLLVVSLVAAVGLSLANISAGDDAPAEGDSLVQTAPVTRETLKKAEKFTGAIGFGDSREIGAAPPQGGGGDDKGGDDKGGDAGGGVITWLPEVGATVDLGEQLWRVDDRPTVLMLGAMPLYRELKIGVRGPEVTQLKANLLLLGFGGFSEDDRFTAATSRAVDAWQKDVGLPRTGRVDASQVVMRPAPVRVAGLPNQVGSAAGPSILAVTGVHRSVSLVLDSTKDKVPDVGAAVRVMLPEGEVAAGVVGWTRPEEKDDGSPPGQTEDTKVVVGVDLEDPTVLDGLDAGKVALEMDVEERPDVLTVPVTALLALAEGGYGVEVGAEERRLVPVSVGLVAGGRAEVEGELAEGDEVVVPS